MAEVFLASTQGAEGFSRKVAIKRVLPGFSDNPAFAGMFVAEAQISSRLVHPNIVSVLDFDRDAENRLFLVMELVEGKDLDALVATGLLPIPVVIFVISEVLRGLGYAHDLPIGTDVRGVVHRDVSPHNVLLSWEGAVKVSDFGIAKARSASEATASVFIKGKPAYMSPEQANGQPLDGRSDLFAVGVMLWEMLVGRRLFVGDDTRATLAAVLFGQIPRPRSIRGDIPKDLERVVMKLLEREVSARYPTAEAAIADLLECADAPKAGREALIALLAERFPNEARVRQSLIRARPSGEITGPAGTPRNVPATGADGTPAYPAPSLSSVMSATTGTLHAPQGARSKLAIRVVLVALVMLASGAVTFALVSSSGGDRKNASAPADAAIATTTTPAPSDAAVAPPPPPGDAAVAAPPPADAAPATPPVDAAVTPDSPPADTPRHTTTRDPRTSPKKFGTLQVRAFPVLSVKLDGKSLGDTPINKQVPVGRHVLRLTNSATGYDEKLTIEIVEGQTKSIDRMK